MEPVRPSSTKAVLVEFVRLHLPIGLVCKRILLHSGSRNATANSLEGGGSLDDVSQALKVLEWCDAHLEEGTFFKDWTPYQHPQLGSIEIGGFKYKKLTQNPPEPMLRFECKSNTDFALILARSLPRVVVTEASAKAMAGGVTQVTLQMQNTGFLRTSATFQGAPADSESLPH